MPAISRKELIRRFIALGFSGPYSGGKHQFMSKDTLKIRIPNPHGNNDIDISLVQEILRQAGIDKNIWDSLGNK